MAVTAITRVEGGVIKRRAHRLPITPRDLDRYQRARRPATLAQAQATRYLQPRAVACVAAVGLVAAYVALRRWLGG